MANQAQIQHFKAPDFATNLATLQSLKSKGQAALQNAALEKLKTASDIKLSQRKQNLAEEKFGFEQDKFQTNTALELQEQGLERDEFEAEQSEIQRENRINELDSILNVLSGVNSQEDIPIARRIINSKFPEYTERTNAILSDYSPRKIDMIRNALRTETQRLKQEERQSKLQSFSPGSSIYQGGELVDRVPTKSDFELFGNEEGDQIYVKKGGKVPDGYSRIEDGGSGVTVNVGEEKNPMPSGERKELSKLQDFRGKLQRITDLFDPKYTGRVQGQVGAAKEMTGVGLEDKETQFRQITKDISDTLLRLRSGAQINEQEYKRMLKLVPNVNLPDEAFKSRLMSLKKTINDSIANRRANARQSGYTDVTGASSTDGSSGSKSSTNVRIKFDSQGNVIDQEGGGGE